MATPIKVATTMQHGKTQYVASYKGNITVDSSAKAAIRRLRIEYRKVHGVAIPRNASIRAVPYYQTLT